MGHHSHKSASIVEAKSKNLNGVAYAIQQIYIPLWMKSASHPACLPACQDMHLALHINLLSAIAQAQIQRCNLLCFENNCFSAHLPAKLMNVKVNTVFVRFQCEISMQRLFRTKLVEGVLLSAVFHCQQKSDFVVSFWWVWYETWNFKPLEFSEKKKSVWIRLKLKD